MVDTVRSGCGRFRAQRKQEKVPKLIKMEGFKRNALIALFVAVCAGERPIAVALNPVVSALSAVEVENLCVQVIQSEHVVGHDGR